VSDRPGLPDTGTPPGGFLSQRFFKTETGRAEIRRRALPLSRPARNLLLIIDASRDGAGWLGLVQGCGEAELRALLAAGLVAVDGSDAAPVRVTLAQALESRGYELLYNRLTAEARPRLGLIRGYKLILEVERCSGPAEIRALALRTVDGMRATDGDAAALAFAQALLAPPT
jgi:hypothetical protein